MIRQNRIVTPWHTTIDDNRNVRSDLLKGKCKAFDRASHGRVCVPEPLTLMFLVFAMGALTVAHTKLDDWVVRPQRSQGGLEDEVFIHHAHIANRALTDPEVVDHV